MELENKIQEFLRRVSNQDLLLGRCESTLKLTATQEHILMLIAREKQLTNAKISEKLNLSAPAVTKAIKKLREDGLIATFRNPVDEREIVLQLTKDGCPIALEHAAHHQKTLVAYKKVSDKFSKNDQVIIGNFLQELEEVLK